MLTRPHSPSFRAHAVGAGAAPRGCTSQVMGYSYHPWQKTWKRQDRSLCGRASWSIPLRQLSCRTTTVVVSGEFSSRDARQLPYVGECSNVGTVPVQRWKFCPREGHILRWVDAYFCCTTINTINAVVPYVPTRTSRLLVQQQHNSFGSWSCIRSGLSCLPRNGHSSHSQVLRG